MNARPSVPKTTSLARSALVTGILAVAALQGSYLLAREFLAAPSLAQARQERAAMAAWPGTPGVLEKFHVKAVHISGSHGGHTEYYAGGEYRYSVAGKDYTGQRLSLDGSAYDSEIFSDLQSKVATLIPGLPLHRPGSGEHLDFTPHQPVTIHYDPANPAASILNNQDAKPLWWAWETGMPVYFWACLVVFGIGMAATSLHRIARAAGWMGEPGSMREIAGGKLIFGWSIPWLWAINLFGWLMAGCGGAIVLVGIMSVPGESHGCMSVLVVGIGVLLALAGIIVGGVPRFRNVLDPSVKTLRQEFFHAWIPFVHLPIGGRPIGDFDHVDLTARPIGKSGTIDHRVSLIPHNGKKNVELFSDDRDPQRVRDVARRVAQVSGLPLWIDGRREE